MSDVPEIKVVGPVGSYQICLKSGASVVLDGVELCTYAPNPNGNPVPPKFFFQRSGERVSFTAHYVARDEGGEKPLDDVTDAIFRIK
ncbi:hypothetical protein ABNQ24_07120 [Ralstonia pseudosolanacearum]|uniref:hypothetical protein n=1 Tax=Ralstonia pseudosolanacearum TaxID=1310165 RepID=UPI00336AC931